MVKGPDRPDMTIAVDWNVKMSVIVDWDVKNQTRKKR